jgi:hypothetical protein
MIVNEVLNTEFGNLIGDVLKNITVLPAQEPPMLRSTSRVGYKCGTVFKNYGQQDETRSSIDSLSHSHNEGVEPGAASSVLNTASIVDMAEHYTNSAHKTDTTVSPDSSLTIGIILLATVFMYESSRIF